MEGLNLEVVFPIIPVELEVYGLTLKGPLVSDRRYLKRVFAGEEVCHRYIADGRGR